jgi:hypothetical protein
VTQSTCHCDNGYYNFLLPRSPAIVALIQAVSSGGIESWI